MWPWVFTSSFVWLSCPWMRGNMVGRISICQSSCLEFPSFIHLEILLIGSLLLIESLLVWKVVLNSGMYLEHHLWTCEVGLLALIRVQIVDYLMECRSCSFCSLPAGSCIVCSNFIRSCNNRMIPLHPSIWFEITWPWTAQGHLCIFFNFLLAFLMSLLVSSPDDWSL